jgi:hypothetical protein
VKQAINYHCLACQEEEIIPYDVVLDYGIMDRGDPIVPPQFSCENVEQKFILNTT